MVSVSQYHVPLLEAHQESGHWWSRVARGREVLEHLQLLRKPSLFYSNTRWINRASAWPSHVAASVWDTSCSLVILAVFQQTVQPSRNTTHFAKNPRSAQFFPREIVTFSCWDGDVWAREGERKTTFWGPQSAYVFPEHRSWAHTFILDGRAISCLLGLRRECRLFCKSHCQEHLHWSDMSFWFPGWLALASVTSDVFSLLYRMPCLFWTHYSPASKIQFFKEVFPECHTYLFFSASSR